MFIPLGACWLNLQEGWWRIFRKTALAGQSFAALDEIGEATRLATAQAQRPRETLGLGRPPPHRPGNSDTVLCTALRNPALERDGEVGLGDGTDVVDGHARCELAQD